MAVDAGHAHQDFIQQFAGGGDSGVAEAEAEGVFLRAYVVVDEDLAAGVGRACVAERLGAAQDVEIQADEKVAAGDGLLGGGASCKVVYPFQEEPERLGRGVRQEGRDAFAQGLGEVEKHGGGAAQGVAVRVGMAYGADAFRTVYPIAQRQYVFAQIHDANLAIILHLINQFHNFVRLLQIN